MGTEKGNITKNIFMRYFGELQNLLRSYRTSEEGYYVTEIAIYEVPNSDEIEVSFFVQYGPVFNYDGDNSLEGDLLDCRFVYVYSKEGVFKGYKGKDPVSSDIDYNPFKSYLPSFEDFPDPEDPDDGLFQIIQDIIAKCGKLNKPLHSIQFCTISPMWTFDCHPGIRSTGYDGGSAPWAEGKVEGISLTDILDDSFSYAVIAKGCETMKGEYDLIFWVKK